MRKKEVSLIKIAIIAVMLFSLSVFPVNAQSKNSGSVVSVTIQGFKFSPADAIVNVGDTVVWTNEDPAPHTIESSDGTLKSDQLSTGDSYKFTFTKAGTYTYSCGIHPSMHGSVKVNLLVNPPKFNESTCKNPSGGTYCGKKSQVSNCYCDTVCTQSKDCCKDYKEVCAGGGGGDGSIGVNTTTCISCASPAAGCKYVGGSCNSCGKLVCDNKECETDKDCPIINCLKIADCPKYACIDGKCSFAKPKNESGFSSVTIICYDDYDGSISGTCKTSKEWQAYGEKICSGRCNKENTKCGMNTFAAIEWCTISIPVPICGNNICEDGEADSVGCKPCTKAPCIGAPCFPGTCPQDCAKDSCTKYYTCPDGSKIKECEPQGTACSCRVNPGSLCPQTEVKEQVKCVFQGLNTEQKCYSDKGKCNGVNSCVVTVAGKKGEQVIWKSSCAGYAYTTIDGQNEYAYFSCHGDPPQPKCDEKLCKPYICCDASKEKYCPAGFPKQCESCTKDICPTTKQITKKDVIDYINTHCFD